MMNFHPVEFYEIWCGFDNSMTHEAKSPDGLDATKLKKSNGGANVEKQRDGWYDTVIDGILTRTVQEMQNASGVQLGLLSNLRERGKHCQKNPDGQCTIRELNKLCNSCRHHTEKEDPKATCCLYGVLSKEPDFLGQKTWLSETVEKYTHFLLPKVPL